ncbi:MAG: dynamin family protein [Methylococcaceae bacterium]
MTHQTTTTDLTHFPRSHALVSCLQNLTETLNATQTLSDGVLTARVIGEFSAGKTRLLRELLQSHIPPALFPVSSLERQTRLPLEITYGETPALTLIERTEDYKQASTLQTLNHFPQREELTQYDPFTHRLRLAIPETHLILHEGDKFSDDNTPKRLFLIDTPGWNSGDDELADSSARSLLVGHHNLALVYVSQSVRLDSQLNAERLREFMDVLMGADFLDKTRLLFVVTHCPPADASRFQEKVTRLVQTLWAELGGNTDALQLDVFCVDFQTLTDSERHAFRETFWRSLLLPLGPGEVTVDPWARAIRQWPEEWQLDSLLQQTLTILQRARVLFGNTLKNGEFVAGMNAHRLLGLNEQAVRQTMRKRWLTQLDAQANEWEAWRLAALPEAHPLADWWSTYWLANIERVLAPIVALLRQTDRVISQLTIHNESLQTHLRDELEPYYLTALRGMNNGFTALIDMIPSVLAEPHPENRIAALMSLALLEARYADYRERYKPCDA